WTPVLGDTLEIVGMSTLALALAEVPSAKLAISVKLTPLVNTELGSAANTKNAPPSATPKLTVPVPELSSAPSRPAEAPSAQFAVAGAVSQTPPPPARLSSSRVTAHPGRGELGGPVHRRPRDRETGAERGARPRLEARARHRHGEVRSLQPGARRHARDCGDDRRGQGRAGRGAVGEVGGQREADATGEHRAWIGGEYEE